MDIHKTFKIYTIVSIKKKFFFSFFSRFFVYLLINKRKFMKHKKNKIYGSKSALMINEQIRQMKMLLENEMEGSGFRGNNAGQRPDFENDADTFHQEYEQLARETETNERTVTKLLDFFEKHVGGMGNRIYVSIIGDIGVAKQSHVKSYTLYSLQIERGRFNLRAFGVEYNFDEDYDEYDEYEHTRDDEDYQNFDFGGYDYYDAEAPLLTKFLKDNGGINFRKTMELTKNKFKSKKSV